MLLQAAIILKQLLAKILPSFQEDILTIAL
jgi:hypothetical protein